MLVWTEKCHSVFLQLYGEWIFYNIGVFIGSAVIPVVLSLVWSRCTYWGVVCGIVGGFCSGIPTWIYLASTQEDGLDELIKSSRELPLCVHLQGEAQ